MMVLTLKSFLKCYFFEFCTYRNIIRTTIETISYEYSSNTLLFFAYICLYILHI